MGRDRRRSTRRACLGAAAGCALLALAAPARAQDEEDAVPPPEVFRGAASSQVASVEADRDALLPVDDLFRFIALDGASVYETDLQTARASLLFPGNGLILGPNLACGTFGAELPPEFAPLLEACSTYDFPLTVKADSSTPSRATPGAVALGAPSDPVHAAAASAAAAAGPEGATSDAAIEALQVLGFPAFGAIPLGPLDQVELDSSIITVEHATSRTDQRIERGVLVVDAEAVLSGVELLGGLVHIGAIQSTSHATDDAAGTRTAEAAFELTGVTVAGIPATITEDGLVVGDPSGGTGPLQQQLQTALNELLAAMHVQVTLLDTEETLDDGEGQAVASAAGLLVEVAADADGLPMLPGPQGDLDPNGRYVGSFQLGTTSAAAGAASFADEVFVPTDPSFGDDDLSFDGSGGDLAVADLPVAAAPAADVTAGPVARERPAPPQLVRVLTDPFGGRMGLVYLSFTFAVLGLCLMPRLTVPARFGTG